MIRLMDDLEIEFLKVGGVSKWEDLFACFFFNHYSFGGEENVEPMSSNQYFFVFFTCCFVLIHPI